VSKFKLLRWLWVIVVSVLAVNLVTTEASAQDPAKKFCRGLLNVTTGFLEVPKNIRDTGRQDGLGMALTYGAAKGMFCTLRRMAVGVYEMVTFLLPLPEGYAPILKDPEYFLGKEKQDRLMEDAGQ
jgi:putative exosortase-associated protein (TIGR04073 family)